MSEPSILVRTDFTRPTQWEVLCGILLSRGPDGAVPDVAVLDNPFWEDATHADLGQLRADYDLVVVADEAAFEATGLRPMILHPHKERIGAQPLWQLMAHSV